MEKLVSIRITILSGPQYAAVIKTTHRRVQRRLRDEDGIIAPSPGVKKFDDECDKKLMARTWTAAGIKAAELREQGGYMKVSMWFEDAMKRYLRWHEQNYRENNKIYGHTKKSVDKFKGVLLADISRKDVRDWILKDLAPNYSNNTIKNMIAVPKAMFNWLIREEMWSGSNPFAQHQWRGTDNEINVKPIISDDEWFLIRSLCPDSYIEQAVTLAFYTGLRPSEVYRVRSEDFNHDELMLTVHVEKTRGRPRDRMIAIPRCLSTWALNHDWREICESTTQSKIGTLRRKHPSLTNLCMASFRKNFAAMMDEADVSHEVIDAHQGRHQNSVLKKHYLRDPYRAVKRMRPHIDRVFDDGEERIRRIK